MSVHARGTLSQKALSLPTDNLKWVQDQDLSSRALSFCISDFSFLSSHVTETDVIPLVLQTRETFDMYKEIND